MFKGSTWGLEISSPKGNDINIYNIQNKTLQTEKTTKTMKYIFYLNRKPKNKNSVITSIKMMTDAQELILRRNGHCL